MFDYDSSSSKYLCSLDFYFLSIYRLHDLLVHALIKMTKSLVTVEMSAMIRHFHMYSIVDRLMIE